ncbi:MAG: 2-hydroxyacyl-CoA dehydratase family protein [Anaerovoracaceae bacterium]
MTNIENILKKFDVSPKKLVEEYKAEGKKIVGCGPMYTPAELVYAAGMAPMALWGSQGEVSLAKQYFAAFYCSVAQRIMEMSLNGTLSDLSAIMIPIQCDTLKALGQNIKVGVKDIEYIHVANAQNRKLECGLEFNTVNYGKVKAQLEKIAGKEITEDALENAIKVFNAQKRKLQEFVKVAAKYPHIITPAKRNLVIKSGQYMDRVKHTEILGELIAALNSEEVKPWEGKKIVTTGILVDSPSLLQILEENKIAIVDDEVAQESRQFRTLSDEGTGNPLRAIAKILTDQEGCSVLYDAEKKRADMIVEKVKAAGADGVLFVQQKFCDPEEFDYVIVRDALNAAGIKQVVIEVDQQMTNYEQARTSLQTFAEML